MVASWSISEEKYQKECVYVFQQGSAVEVSAGEMSASSVIEEDYETDFESDNSSGTVVQTEMSN
jgi:hypothetical protein